MLLITPQFVKLLILIGDQFVKLLVLIAKQLSDLFDIVNQTDLILLIKSLILENHLQILYNQTNDKQMCLQLNYEQVTLAVLN